MSSQWKNRQSEINILKDKFLVLELLAQSDGELGCRVRRAGGWP